MKKIGKTKVFKMQDAPLPENPVESMLALGSRTSTQAVGTSGTQIYGGVFAEEYLHRLTANQAADEWDKIRRSEAQVAMLLAATNNPIKSAQWDVESADQNNPDLAKHAEFIEHILFNTLPNGFQAFLQEALSFIPFGFCAFEIVHNIVKAHPEFGDYNGLANLGFRSQRSIFYWRLEKKTGRLLAIEQQSYGDVSDSSTIPGEFCLVISNNKEGDNYEGISALRPMYGAYQRKNLYLKLAAIGTEKYALGTPIGTVPAGKSQAVEAAAFQQVLQAYTSNEKAYIIKPEGWTIEILKQQFDADKIVQLLQFENTEMINAMVANFLALGTGGNGGAYALGQDLSDFFLNGIQIYADMICETINLRLIPQLIKLNYGEQAEYPFLKCTGINDKAGKELAEIIGILSQNKALTPDTKLEDYLRSAYELPQADAATARQVQPTQTFGGGQQAPVQFTEASVFKFAEDKYKAQFKQNVDATKLELSNVLRSVYEKMIKNLETNFDNSNGTNFIKAADKLEYGGITEAKAAIRELMAQVATQNMAGALKEMGLKGKNVKLTEFSDTMKFEDYAALPPKIKAIVQAAADAVVDTKILDIEKIVRFQFLATAKSTDDFRIIEKDIDEKISNLLDGGRESGASIDVAAGDLISSITQSARNFVFFDSEVANTIESFTFTNEDPVSPICQDLAGTTFAADDPEAEKYFAPLHHNCKSRLVPNIKGDSGNPPLTEGGLRPSRSSLEKYITLTEKLANPSSAK